MAPGKTSEDELHLDQAAWFAAQGMEMGAGGPFGAMIVQGGKIVAAAHNTVLRTNDPTSHAEVNAIRKASEKLGRFDLSGCTIYSTTEPCPMCFSAIHWARIDKVVYSTTIQDVKKLGFNELSIPNTKMKSLGKSPVTLKKIPNAACKKLLSDWKQSPNRKTY